MPEVTRDELRSELLNIQQACRRAGVSRRTIYNWLAKGFLRYVRTAGGAVRIEAASLFRTTASRAKLPQESTAADAQT